MTYLKSSHVYNLERVIQNKDNEFNDEEIKTANQILKNNGHVCYGDLVMDFNNLFFRIEQRQKEK